MLACKLLNIRSIIMIYKNLSISKKAGLWYIICNLLQKGIAFIVLPIYVHLLSPSEYGRYTIFQSWCNIFIIFATLNLYCGVFTKSMVDYSNDRDRYTSCMQGLSSSITFVWYILYLVFSEKILKLLDFDTVTANLMFVYFISYPALSFWMVRQRVENKYISMVLVSVGMSLFTPAISVALLLFTNLNSAAVIYGFLISQILFGLFFYFYHFSKSQVFYVRSYWVRALKFNIPLIPHYLSLILLGQFDRVLIGKFCGEDKSGIYALAYQLALALQVFTSGINGAYIPWCYERLKTKKYTEIRQKSNILALILASLVCVLILTAPDLIYIIGSNSYLEAIWVLPPIAVGVFVTFCYSFYCNVEFYYNATEYIAIATIIGAILNISLNYLLLPVFGYLSAAYTSLTCYLVFMLMHRFFMKKVCVKKADGAVVYDNTFLNTCVSFLLIFMLACSLMYNYIIIRYVLLVLFVAVMFFYKNKIREVLIFK